jgi:transposase
MPQDDRLSRFLLLPELKLVAQYKQPGDITVFICEKVSDFEVCPRCANKSDSIYDHRIVKIHDNPIRATDVWLKIKKRRFYCGTCRKPFTEPVLGIMKGKRHTERFRRSVLWASENFTDLTRVRKHFRCSTWTVYRSLYDHLQLNIKRHLNYPWPKTVGIDEHFFSRAKGFREFATVFVDYDHKRVRELALGRSGTELKQQVSEIAGRENVKNVVCDLSDPYKSFAKEFFPQAQIIADKFHVLRLLNPAINRHRKTITGDKRTNPVRKLLLRSGKTLQYFERAALYRWLNENPDLREIYHCKEALHGFYRIKSYRVAAKILTRMTDQMALSKLPEIKTLRRTLMRWREQILNYFKNRITNARTEGFNNVAKLIQKRAYGVKSFKFYRLRYLNACA